jgi:hypothetical protein
MSENSFSYNLRENDLSVIDVAWHRAAAVTVGVLWAALLSRFWWPAEARRELGKVLGELSGHFVHACLNTYPSVDQILFRTGMVIYKARFLHCYTLLFAHTGLCQGLSLLTRLLRKF